MKNCVFCKIVEGKLPSFKIYENSYVFSFLDINPVSNGHTLVIPKKHIENFENCDKRILNEIVITIKKISKALKKSLEINSLNIVLNDGKEAGQIIKHLHFHIIPRISGDKITIDKQKTLKIDKKEFEKIAEKIKKSVK